jgi:hypothetical protein
VVPEAPQAAEVDWSGIEGELALLEDDVSATFARCEEMTGSGA